MGYALSVGIWRNHTLAVTTRPAPYTGAAIRGLRLAHGHKSKSDTNPSGTAESIIVQACSKPIRPLNPIWLANWRASAMVESGFSRTNSSTTETGFKTATPTPATPTPIYCSPRARTKMSDASQNRRANPMISRSDIGKSDPTNTGKRSRTKPADCAAKLTMNAWAIWKLTASKVYAPTNTNTHKNGPVHANFSPCRRAEAARPINKL